MKKHYKLISAALSLIAAAALSFTVIPDISASAEEEVTVEFDGKELSFDVNPRIIDNYTMVPLRKIFEEIGALVKWDDDTQTAYVRKSSKTVSMTIDTKELKIDKGKADESGNPIIETVELETCAQIINNRTLVPVRAVSEAFGLDVNWDETNKKVIITSKDENDDSWKLNVASVNLSDLTYNGDGVEISDNKVSITRGGDYTLTGNLSTGSVHISTDDKVKLRLCGVSITSSTDPCIFVESADKAYITIEDNTENTLTSTDCENGTIYSKDNLEIKGDGKLNISSSAGHAIKASDNLVIEDGIINLSAFGDGIHVNDTFKMKGGEVSANSVGDGIDSESIVIISGGRLNIKTNGVPIENKESEQTSQPFGRWDENNDVEFEKSTKGINAEWMMCISGGTLTIDSAYHAVHCADEIEITGGTFELSSEYGKGISAHGNLTVSNADTSINIKKSTEGLESKKTAVINDGTIKIISSDDGINATGGTSGEMPGGQPPEMRPNGNGNQKNPPNPPENETPPSSFEPPANPAEFNNHPSRDKKRPESDENRLKGDENRPDGQAPPNTSFDPPEKPVGDNDRDMANPPSGGGFRHNDGDRMNQNAKNCLIINGGDIEIISGDDCIDSNGNLILNGGIIKAVKENGTFTGPFSVLDADGSVTINEGTALIAAGNGGTQGSLEIPQNNITVYGEATHNANEKIVLKDENGDIIIEFSPLGSYSAVLLTSPKISTGKTYSISLGSEVNETEICDKDTVIGTPKNGGFKHGR